MYGSFHSTHTHTYTLTYRAQQSVLTRWPSTAVTSHMWLCVDIRSNTSGKLELVGPDCWLPDRKRVEGDPYIHKVVNRLQHHGEIQQGQTKGLCSSMHNVMWIQIRVTQRDPLILTRVSTQRKTLLALMSLQSYTAYFWVVTTVIKVTREVGVNHTANRNYWKLFKRSRLLFKSWTKHTNDSLNYEPKNSRTKPANNL